MVTEDADSDATFEPRSVMNPSGAFIADPDEGVYVMLFFVPDDDWFTTNWKFCTPDEELL